MSRVEGDHQRLPWLTMSDVLDRPEPFEVISNYGVGGNAKNRGRRTSAEPAFTATGKINRCKILTKDYVALPRFTLAEAGRLQSFPADYPWAGNNIAQQIGNAMPPLLAVHVLAAALGRLQPPEDTAIASALRLQRRSGSDHRLTSASGTHRVTDSRGSSHLMTPWTQRCEAP
ncbi:DNA cytosine methyltransferase [Streptomyces albulus]|nr:DNA cytosine methyltransferase [Streptomyces noursei]MCZ1015531.1 DNA cytosine methyltransferase [Streptomyces noursei]GGW88905.1 hypothetical protein GCM10010341_07000 [Streptomyces noursei]